MPEHVPLSANNGQVKEGEETGKNQGRFLQP